MEHVCWITPVLPGEVETAREFAAELSGPRRSELVAAEQRIGVAKEMMFLAELASGPALVFYMESEDVSATAQVSVSSEHEFDRWYNEMFTRITGRRVDDEPGEAELLMCFPAPGEPAGASA